MLLYIFLRMSSNQLTNSDRLRQTVSIQLHTTLILCRSMPSIALRNTIFGLLATSETWDLTNPSGIWWTTSFIG